MECPSCGADAPPEARFCGTCGLSLRAQVEERRVVSVLFADLVGFTGLSEQLDPEQIKHLVDAAFERLVHDVVTFGGRVDKIVGDAVVALFGAPVAHEDDAERAVRAALRMQETLNQFASETSLAIRMRVGVNTGEVLVGALRAGGDYTAMGDVVNIASRLQTSADPGTVLVGASTRLATEDTIGYEPQGALVVRGRDEPVEAFRALEPKARPGARPWSPRMPLVGRNTELSLLGDAVSASIERSRALVLLLSGDAGVGKSRLADELAERANQVNGARTFTGRFIPYGEANQWSAIAEVLRQGLGLGEEAPEDEARSTTAASVERLLDPVLDGNDVEGVTNGLLHLMGYASPLRGTDPGRARVEATRALVSYMLASVRLGPIVVRLTDLHWADDSVLALIDEFAARMAAQPLVVLATARRSLMRRWSPQAGRHDMLVMNLDPLEGDDAEMLLWQLSRDRDLSPEVTAEVLERSGGNPLFMEELVRFLARSEETPAETTDAGTDALPELPDTLRGLLSARMDAMSPDEQAVVADASVWGPSGSLVVLEQMAGAREVAVADLGETLRRLGEREILVLTSTDWRFRNDLLREVAYGRLTKTERLRRHYDVARFLSHLAATREADDGLVEAVARHYTEAALLQPGLLESDRVGPEVDEAALAWTEDAAARAEAAANWLLVERLLGRALRVVDVEDRPRRLAYILGRAGARLERWATEEAGADLDAAANLVGDDPVAGARVELLRADLERRRGRFDRAERRTEEALDALGKAGATSELAEALRLLAVIRLFKGDATQAEAPATAALELYREQGNSQGEAWATQHLAWIAFMKGNIEEGERRIRQSVQLFEVAGDRTGLMWSLGLEANLLFHGGAADEAAEVAEVVLEEAELADNPWGQGMMLSVLAQVALWQGDTVGAADRAEEAVALLEPLGDPFGSAQARLVMGRAQVMVGRVHNGMAELERATREGGEQVTNQAVSRAACEALLGELSAGPARHLLDRADGPRNVGSAELVATAALALVQDGADGEARSVLADHARRWFGDDPQAVDERPLSRWRSDLDALRNGQRHRGVRAVPGGQSTRREAGADLVGPDPWSGGPGDWRNASGRIARPPVWSVHLHPTAVAQHRPDEDPAEGPTPYPPEAPLDDGSRSADQPTRSPEDVAPAEAPGAVLDGNHTAAVEHLDVSPEVAAAARRQPSLGAVAALAEAVGDEPERADTLARLVAASGLSTYHDRAMACLSSAVAAARTDRPEAAMAAVEAARAELSATGDRLMGAVVALGAAQVAASVGDDRAEHWGRAAEAAWEDLAVKPKGWRRLWRRVLP
ncbi:MAG: adenylate/guanylate cyclase domain-containing protein [Microthrixaceae bacterium]